MRLSILFTLLVVSTVLGFAPAPLPRRDRVGTRDDLEAMQGTWRMTSYDSNGRPIGHSYKCRIKGNRWTFFSLDNGAERQTASYVFNLETKINPRAFEWLQSEAANSGGWVGSYRLEGSGRKLTLIFGTGTLKNGIANRPTDFNSAPTYKMTLDFLGR